ncbi:hypothetical protein EDC02_1951 [Micromonospora sp. Llam0]|uniref:hypothetical protein n=1 Tax=Micromonospora sp. Llam0 TaxID=2485143 RepID=UPI000F46F7FA|nr:hypothetical protein [Micromonospora sp. Llam0]ROO60093.1 hypothetical protein EDC02_1951 [Micromonospora sp. Llam0]
MTNVQQPEMRRSGDNPLVQESKGPDGADRRPGRRGGGNRPVPAGQVSPYGPHPPVADDDSERDDRPD